MKFKIGAFILILVIGFLLYSTISLTGNTISENNQNLNTYCKDSDDENANQETIQGFAIYHYNKCETLESNCSFSFTLPDICKNENILIEQTCEENNLKSIEIECINGCSNGSCLE